MVETLRDVRVHFELGSTIAVDAHRNYCQHCVITSKLKHSDQFK